MDLERIVLISIITILSTIGGVFLFNKITDTWIGLQEEAKKKEKRIEYILLIVTSFAVLISLISIIINVYQDNKINRLDEEINLTQKEKK